MTNEIAEKLIREAAEKRYSTVTDKYKWICKDCFIEGGISVLRTLSFDNRNMKEAYEAGYNDAKINKVYTFNEWLQMYEVDKFGSELAGK